MRARPMRPRHWGHRQANFAARVRLNHTDAAQARVASVRTCYSSLDLEVIENFVVEATLVGIQSVIPCG